MTNTTAPTKKNTTRRPATTTAKTPPTAALVVTLPELCALLQIGRSLAYTLMKEGKLPPQLPIGRRRHVWSRAAVARWIEQGCPAQSDHPEGERDEEQPHGSGAD